MRLDRTTELLKNRYVLVVIATIAAFASGVGVNALMSASQNNEIVVTEDLSDDNSSISQDRATAPPPELLGPESASTEASTSTDYDFDYDFDDYYSSTSNNFSSDNQRQSSSFEPVCLDELKESSVNLYNSRVSNEKTRYQNAVNQEETSHVRNKRTIRSDFAARGMAFSGAVELEINKEVERHERVMKELESNHENELVRLEAEHLNHLASIDCL
jgi:hypothetical protein